MQVIATPLDGVLILAPKVFGDARGFFFESFNARRFEVTVRVASAAGERLAGVEVQFNVDRERSRALMVVPGASGLPVGAFNDKESLFDRVSFAASSGRHRMTTSTSPISAFLAAASSRAFSSASAFSLATFLAASRCSETSLEGGLPCLPSVQP